MICLVKRGKKDIFKDPLLFANSPGGFSSDKRDGDGLEARRACGVLPLEDCASSVHVER